MRMQSYGLVLADGIDVRRLLLGGGLDAGVC